MCQVYYQLINENVREKRGENVSRTLCQSYTGKKEESEKSRTKNRFERYAVVQRRHTGRGR